MTPTDVVTAARDIYNGVGDNYFSDLQIYAWMTEACSDLAKKSWIIERVYTASTVAGTQDYSYPTNTIAITRVIVNGKKIKRITLRDDDAITLSNQTVTTQGQPIYYTDFNYTISMRPIPDDIYAIKIYSFNGPQDITATSSLEIPSTFHFSLVDYILFRMFSKDKDVVNANSHYILWQSHVKDAIALRSKKRRSDGFAVVQSEDTLPVTILGMA